MNYHPEKIDMSKLEGHGSYTSYWVGFIISLAITLFAYWLTKENMLSGNTQLYTLTVLAVLQFIVQLFFFLHLGQDKVPYWNVMTFIFMLIILLMIVFGSLWVMNNLDYRMMPDMNNSMKM